LLDHTVKAALFVVVVEAGSQSLLALERLAGFDPPPIMDRTYLARTPAEFWFRWNQRLRMWFFDNVFLPGGGRRRPVQGVFAVFAASALLHEVAFGIATSRFTGCQAIFFLLQAPAVVLSPRLQRLTKSAGALGQLAAHGLTGVWLLATSVFFFEGIHRVFPFFYASQPWLP
jgi:D-alanyl-lipoteichoic acid acyltransferase DltB (MBOAT superfamily)